MTLAFVLIFRLLFTTSSGILKGQALSYQEERDNYYHQDLYDKNSLYETNRGSNDLSFLIDTPRIIRGILEAVDKEKLEEIGDKLFEGVDKERLLNNAQNLLKNFDLQELYEQLLQDEINCGLIFFIIILLIIEGIIPLGESLFIIIYLGCIGLC